MKIKGKIFLSLIMTILMIGPSISGPYIQEGYIVSVQVDMQTQYCTLEVTDKSSPNKQIGTWYCNNIPGRALLDLAKIAALLDRPVEVVLKDSNQTMKEVLGITLKQNQ
ncbi:hypothetical protein ABID39_000529 [Bartonella japonica]|uniref:Uncharacterized protein n=1 Tax=Bartonella japonica TaxID=357761 RepID=A0ABV2FMV9_9HYPH